MPAQRGRRSGVRELFALTTIGFAVVLACSTAPSAMGLPGDVPVIEAPPSQKPNITQLTESMLVDQSSFPNIQPSGFVHAISGNRVQTQVSPPECAPIAVGYNTPQSGYAGLVMTQGRLDMTITVVSDPPDIQTLRNNCGTVTGSGPLTPLVTWNVQPLDLAGVPSWAGAAIVSGDAKIFGTYRGVFIQSNSSLDRESDALKIFNDEVAKLEAA
jgi:hypothetical protein